MNARHTLCTVLTLLSLFTAGCRESAPKLEPLKLGDGRTSFVLFEDADDLLLTASLFHCHSR